MATEHVRKADLEKQQQQEEIIESRTPIRLGTAAILVGFFCTTVVSSAWFIGSKLSTLETKMDSIGVKVDTAAKDGQGLKDELNQHEREQAKSWAELKGELDSRIRNIEQNGSQATRDLAKDLSTLRKDFEVYVAIQTQQLLPKK